MGVSSRMPARTLDVARLYKAHAPFVVSSLARLGVRDRDLEDLLQEVFVVVYRKIDTYSGEGSLRSWLFSICRRVVANYRRHVLRKHELATADSEFPELASERTSPEEAAEARERRARLELVLSRISDPKRVVFVMFEIEGKTPAEIAAILEIPIGTVHSRVHAARQDFERIAEKLALVPNRKAP